MANWFEQHVLQPGHRRPQRQIAALATLVLVVGIIIGALYLSQSSATSTLGRQLEEMIEIRNNLEQQNEQLRAEIASLRSVPRLLERAAELGFAPANRDEIEYLVIDGYNPNRETLVIDVEPEAEPLPVYDESFTGWVQQQWDLFRVEIEAFTSRGATP
ncbi:MAG: hypothetical protein GYB67_17640 [Chloroflexi bacterium]|nr:hypothetical protein [Chloroflexota bacterium]